MKKIRSQTGITQLPALNCHRSHTALPLFVCNTLDFCALDPILMLSMRINSSIQLLAKSSSHISRLEGKLDRIFEDTSRLQRNNV